MKKENKKYMQLAIREARKNLGRMYGGPFGACIVKNGRVIAVSRNTVLKYDATCHAEINAIRQASRKLKTYDLSGCVIYSTNEPCPMCFSAIHWAGLDAVVYGTTIKDAAKIGFNEMPVSSALLKKIGDCGARIIRSRLAGECRKLLKEYNRLPNKKIY